MATLAQLKTRVITELNRDDMGSGGDLETVLSDTIDRAIEHYADYQFWFNRDTGTRTTTGGSSYVALPSSMRRAELVSYLDQPLIKVPLEQIEHLTDSGVPTRWAEDGGNIRLWPIPDGSYTLSIYGTANLGTPTTSNAWTVEAYDLIAARVRLVLYRDIMRDAEGVQFASMAEAEALGKLLRESRKRRLSPLRAREFNVVRFNINRGW